MEVFIEIKCQMGEFLCDDHDDDAIYQYINSSTFVRIETRDNEKTDPKLLLLSCLYLMQWKK